MLRYIALYEAKQTGIIYHFTTISNFVDIVQDNYTLKSSSITGAQGIGTYVSNNISFTRNFKLNSKVVTLDIRIDIDGNKLSNKYKIKSFLDNEISRFAQENEEIVLSNKINIKPYIKNIVFKNNLFKQFVTLIDKNKLIYIKHNLSLITEYSLSTNGYVFKNLEYLFNDNILIYFVHEFVPHNKLYEKI